MALREPDSLAMVDEMRQLARRLDAAKHGEQGQMVKNAANLYGWSTAKVYRQLKSIGWESGRKARADRGSSRQSMDAVQDLGATLRIGVRKNGKATMHTPNAVSLLAANEREINVSNSRINTLLRHHKLDLAAQRTPAPVQSMQSLHPNHVHQVDPSLCLVYYLPDGSQHIMRDDEFYKNKLENIAKLKLKVWRYVLTDHFSASIVVRYYQARGESQANLYDFLLYAWQQSPGRLIHGVPKVLLWDKGSANTAGAIKNALRALQVEAIEHKAGNPRAKGGVENGNNLVECNFESRLMYEPVENVDQLNAAAEAWYNAYNANAIPHYDSRLQRKFMREPQVRYGLWQMIRQEQLRLLPELALCRMLLSGADVERQVAADLTVSFKHPVTKQREHYDVSHIAGIHVRQVVKVSPLVYGDAEILLTVTDYKGDQVTQVIKPIEVNSVSGFRVDAAIIGTEFKSQPDTNIERAGKAADQRAYEGTQEDIEKAKQRGDTPFGGLDAHTHLKHVSGPAFVDRPGQMLNVPDRLHVEIKPLSLIETKMKLRNILGRPVNAEESALLKTWYPEGVLVEQLQEVLDRLEGGEQLEMPKLVAVK